METRNWVAEIVYVITLFKKVVEVEAESEADARTIIARLYPLWTINSIKEV